MSPSINHPFPYLGLLVCRDTTAIQEKVEEKYRETIPFADHPVQAYRWKEFLECAALLAVPVPDQPGRFHVDPVRVERIVEACLRLVEEYCLDLLERDDRPPEEILDHVLSWARDTWAIDPETARPLIEELLWPAPVRTRGRALRAVRPAPAPRGVRKHTDVSFPARVPAGQLQPLRVRIVGAVKGRPPPHPHDAELSLEAPAGGGTLLVGVSVVAEGFAIEGDAWVELAVPVEGASLPAVFRLRGQQVGPGRIILDFQQDGRPVGSVELYPEIVAPGSPSTPVPAAAAGGPPGLALGPGESPEVVLKVYEQRLAGTPGRLQFVLYSSDPRLQDLPVLDGDLGTIDLRTDLAGWVDAQLRRVVAAARQPAGPGWAERTLAAVGKELYSRLLPERLQRIYWVLRKRQVRTVWIWSDTPHIPWELLRPHRVDPDTGAVEEDDYLGATFALGHWLRGRPPADRLSLDRVCAVAAGAGTRTPSLESSERELEYVASGPAPPRPALPLADEELGVLRSLGGRGCAVEVLPALRGEVCTAIDRGEFDVFHLACHGLFGGVTAGDSSELVLEDGRVQATELFPPSGERLRQRLPLIFFNACHSARLGESLTGLGSWAARVVQAGAGAFVGALWPVTERGAVAFAREFYAALAGGATIAKAVQQARLAIRREDDPTWLAYTCFANPQARWQRSG